MLALLSVLWNVPGALAIGLIVFPRRIALRAICWRKHIPNRTSLPRGLRGLSELRILFWHVVWVAGPQLLAVAGVSRVSIAVGAAIPGVALVCSPELDSVGFGRRRLPAICHC